MKKRGVIIILIGLFIGCLISSLFSANDTNLDHMDESAHRQPWSLIY